MGFLRATRQGFIRIQRAQRYLWRAVDQDGVVPDVLVQPRRDGKGGQTILSTVAERPSICSARDRDR